MARGRKHLSKPKHATCEAILQHIGRVHFNNQKHFIYEVRFPNGPKYKILYDWVNSSSDHTRFHPELPRLLTSPFASPFELIAKIRGGVTRNTAKPCKFSVKSMIRVFGIDLTGWEVCGTFASPLSIRCAY
jgi:hypothetical protein